MEEIWSMPSNNNLDKPYYRETIIPYWKMSYCTCRIKIPNIGPSKNMEWRKLFLSFLQENYNVEFDRGIIKEHDENILLQLSILFTI